MASLGRRLTSYLLGAFVCAELIYLPLANFIQFVPRRSAPLPDEILGRLQREGQATEVKPAQAMIDTAGDACDRWGEATAQAQGWSLFAPPPEAGTFLTLDVFAEDGSRRELRSHFEPADVEHFVRFDVLNYRLFYREMSYAVIYSPWKPDSFATRGADWRRSIRKHLATFRRSLPAYIRWRLREEIPGVVAKDVVVNVRVFVPAKPWSGVPRSDAFTVPLAKWHGDKLSAFDPVRGQFDE